MKVTVSRESLNRALSTVARALGRTPIPVLTGIHFEAQGDRLTLRASDMALTIQTSVACTVDESGSCVIDGKSLLSLVKRIEFGDIHLQRNANNTAMVGWGKSRYTLQGFAGDSYPTLPDSENAVSLTLSQGALKRMLHQTTWAVSADTSKPWLSGVKVSLEGSKLMAFATNTERMSIASSVVDNEDDSRFGVIVPGESASEVVKLISGDDKPMRMSVAHNGVWFEFGDTLLHSRLVDGQYPDILRFIPTMTENEIVLDRRELLEAVERVSAVVGSGVRFEFVGKTLTLDSNKVEGAAGREELLVKSADKDVRTILDPSFLSDYLRVVEEADVRLWIDDAKKPVCVKPVDSEDSTYVLMPLLVVTKK